MTGRDIVERALQLIHVLASGEAADAADLELSRLALNTMIEHWSIQPHSILVPAMVAIPLVDGQAVYRIGPATAVPAPDFVTPRPASLLDASFVRYQLSDAPVKLTTLADYNLLITKTSQGWPATLYFEPGIDTSTLTLYPVPTAGMTLYLAVRGAIAQFPDLDTDVPMSPGYKRTLQYALACEIADDFSRPVSPRVERIANDAIRVLKRSNAIVPTLGLPSAVAAPTGYNWRTGY